MSFGYTSGYEVPCATWIWKYCQQSSPLMAAVA